MGLYFNCHPLFRALAVSFLLALIFLTPSQAQQAAKNPAEKAENPAQFEVLETRYRFEDNGDSRKEVHARVHINSELGVRQFARLNFDYNRSFQSVDIPLVHITHPTGGTADILPSAITDNPNPAVVNAPGYQNVRVKSVRILGLEPGDTLEYQVMTTTHHPLGPDFWLDHTFDRTGVVSEESFEIDFSSGRQVQLRINPATPALPIETAISGRTVYQWLLKAGQFDNASKEHSQSQPDVVLTTFASWQQLADRLRNLLKPSGELAPELLAKANELAKVPTSDPTTTPSLRAEAFYTFVSQKIRTVDLPLGSTGFKTRNPSDVLASGYGTPEDKYVLFAALADNFFGPARAGLISSSATDAQTSLPQPASFDHLLTTTGWPSINFWLDLNIEVAPYKVIPSQFRRKKAFMVGPAVTELWQDVDNSLPFPARQSVLIDASITSAGMLTAKVHYSLRGDNELLLRVGFHQTPKEKWQDLAQLLSLSDGFRGQVTSVDASDPYATREPLTVDYEITQAKFVDWSKKPLRMPALLPQLGLPDPPAKPAPGAATAPIELGIPLEVATKMALQLPPGTTATAPTGTSVQRDYATYSSQYAVSTRDAQKGLTITASRHINFLLRQVAAERAADYNAFLRAVLNDQAQDFTLDREPAAAAASKLAGSQEPARPKP
ncbi:MAG TPA: DUF3857 domain-containing protein [Candidatus Cybelea sp.]|nr:DUF3857 domain-containing protein [Candidatus Cybelea sp.]